MSRKKSNEMFLEEVKALVNSEYTPLETYKDNATKILLKHNKCNHIYKVSPNMFLSGRRCPKCYGTPKKTHEQFIQEVKALVNEEYKVIGTYKTTNSKIKMKHMKCCYEWEITPNSFFRGRRCPKCANNIKMDIETFNQKVQDKHGGDFVVLSKEYKNNKTPVLVKHIRCGRKYKVRPDRLLRGDGCSKCSGLMKRTSETFGQEVKKITGTEYFVIGDYVNAMTKIKLKHKHCNYEFEVTPNDFINSNSRCPKCAIKSRVKKLTKTTEMFKKEMEELVGDEYVLIGNYKNRKEKCLIKHQKCSYVYESYPYSFLQGNRCPKCYESNGEANIRHFLISNNIKFETQYKFDDCKNKRKLPFDFAVFNGEEIFALIEYQGRQHYTAVEIFGGEKEFLNRKRNDKIKREYCKRNKIPLIEISYKEKRIETFLNKEFDKLKTLVQLSIL